MSARSSTCSALAAIAIAACGKSSGAPAQAQAPAEADPAKVVALAQTMLANPPAPAAVRDCGHQDLAGGLTLTQPTLLAIAGKPIANDTEHASWINPSELDAPAARAVVDAHGKSPADRQAAAPFLAAPFYVVYRVDMVDAPLAIAHKELKRGTVSARVIRYERTGLPSCATVFYFQNTKQVSDDAIARSDKTLVDPAVVEMVRKDLYAQYLASAPR
jgi:hypothetical protein